MNPAARLESGFWASSFDTSRNLDSTMPPPLLRRIFAFQLLEEASLVAGVAYWPRGLSLYKKGIAIAILGNGLQSEEIARGFSLVPQYLPAAAVEPDISAG